MSLKKKATTGIVWTLIQQFGSQGVNFIIQVFLARIIAPKEFGLFGLIIIFNSLGNTLSNAGFALSVVRTDNPNKKDYGTVFLSNLISSTLLYFVIFLMAPWVSDFYNQPRLTNIIRVFSLSIIISSFSTIQIIKLTKELNFKTQAIVEIPSILLSGIVGIVLGMMNYGIWALVALSVSKSFLLSLQLWLFSSWRPPLIFSKERFKYHWDFGYKMLFSQLLGVTVKNIYPNVIGFFNPLSQVAFYNRAVSYQNLPVLSFSAALDKVSLPLFAEIKNNDSKLKEAFKKMLELSTFFIGPLMFLLILIAKPLIILLIGEKWLPVVPYFQLLCSVGFAYPISLFNLSIIKAKGKSNLILKSAFIKQSISLIILIITAQIGVTAIVIGQVLATTISLFINQYFCNKIFKYSSLEQLKDVLIILLPGIISLIICYLLVLPMFTLQNLWLEIIFVTTIFISLNYGIQYFLNKRQYTELIGLYKQIKRRR